MTLAEKLTALRAEQKLSQGDLAEKLEVSRQSVSKWETGQSVPDLDKIIRLADLFGVTVDELVREEERPQPERPAPQVIYVEKQRGLTPLQIMGIVLEAAGAVGVVLGLMSNSVLVLLGLGMVLLGLPLMLAKKHPLLVEGWLIAAACYAVFNPWITSTPPHLYGGIRLLILYCTVPGCQYRTILLGGCIALARGVLTLVLILCTWRTWKKRRVEKSKQF